MRGHRQSWQHFICIVQFNQQLRPPVKLSAHRSELFDTLLLAECDAYHVSDRFYRRLFDEFYYR